MRIKDKDISEWNGFVPPYVELKEDCCQWSRDIQSNFRNQENLYQLTDVLMISLSEAKSIKDDEYRVGIVEMIIDMFQYYQKGLLVEANLMSVAKGTLSDLDAFYKDSE